MSMTAEGRTTEASNDRLQKKAEQQEAQREVKENYESLRADITELAQSVKNMAGAQFGDTLSNAQESAEKGMADFERRIRKNPTQSAMIAAGVGFLVGLLIAR